MKSRENSTIIKADSEPKELCNEDRVTPEKSGHYGWHLINLEEYCKDIEIEINVSDNP